MKGPGIHYKKIMQHLEYYIFQNFKQNFRNITYLLTTSVLMAVERHFAYQAKGIDVLYKKIQCYLKKIIFEYFILNLRKNLDFCSLLPRTI